MNAFAASRWMFLSLIVVTTVMSGATYPRAEWPVASPADEGMVVERLHEARDFALTGGGAGAIIRHGKLVYSWGDQAELYDLKSTTKSIGGTVLGLALKDGKVGLDDLAAKYHPELVASAGADEQKAWFQKITLRQLANQCAGFEKEKSSNKLLYAPGTKYMYSDSGPNVLAECLTLVYGRDLNDVMFERVFTPLGITPRDIQWRKNSARPDLIEGIKRREFGAGFSANMRAMSRFGYLYLRNGAWNGQQIVTEEYVRLVSRPAPELHGLEEYGATHGNTAEHYSLLWWNNADSRFRDVPRDAFHTAGMYNSYILVIPSLDLVVVRAGRAWPPPNQARTQEDRRSGQERFFGPIVASIAGFTPRPAPVRCGPRAQAPHRRSAGEIRPQPVPASEGNSFKNRGRGFLEKEHRMTGKRTPSQARSCLLCRRRPLMNARRIAQ